MQFFQVLCIREACGTLCFHIIKTSCPRIHSGAHERLELPKLAPFGLEPKYFEEPLKLWGPEAHGTHGLRSNYESTIRRQRASVSLCFEYINVIHTCNLSIAAEISLPEMLCDLFSNSTPDHWPGKYLYIYMYIIYIYIDFMHTIIPRETLRAKKCRLDHT